MDNELCSDIDFEDESQAPKRKKGTLNRNLWKRERIKIARLSRKTAGGACNCKKKCTDKFSVGQKQHIIKDLYDGRPKNEADVYLSGLIERKDVKIQKIKPAEEKQWFIQIFCPV
ncbi:hypothetical protein ABEB36_014522 [Hypothenemus hampei]|uniref:Uncharacterized protein n=1 Tax=Hypothenemus hampei TaxID=57062 RepID=A0ABD1E213_HYPHA